LKWRPVGDSNYLFPE